MTDWWRDQRVPVTFLAGYLGAGKTTLVNHLLATSGRRIAVLVNDVGAVNIDAALIAAADGDTIELTDGCVCCSLAAGLGPALDVVRQRATAPEHVVIELSGVAEPARITAWAGTPGFRYDAVVALADPDVEERRSDPRLRELVDAQLDAADLVLLTKCDLDDADGVRRRRVWAEGRTPAPVLRSAGAPPAAVVLGVRATAPDVRRLEESTADERHDVEVLEAIDYTDAALHALLENRPGDVVRIKGVVRLDGRSVLVQAVGRRVQVLPTTLEPTGLVVVSVR